MKCLLAFSAPFLLLCISTNANADDPDWASLRAIVANDDMRGLARVSALGLACDRASVEGAADMLSLASSWVDSLNQSGLSRAEMAESPQHCGEHSLVCALACSGTGACLDSQNNPDAMLALWTSIATRSWTDQHVKESAFQLIAHGQASAPARKAAALTAIRDSGVGRAGKLPAAFAGLIDSFCVSDLRDMVRASSDPETFNFTAAAVLADMGDSDILTDLQGLQSSFHAADERYGRAIDWYVFQIERQNPSSGLIAHISAANVSPQSRIWAAKRAGLLGLTGSDVRQAIFDYAASAPLLGPERIGAGLPVLKAVGLQFGVLSGEDLPTITASAVSNDGLLQPGATWEVNTPAVPWQPPWEPAYANFDALTDWIGGQHWNQLTNEQARSLLGEKLCELELMPPSRCVPPSQP